MQFRETLQAAVGACARLLLTVSIAYCAAMPAKGVGPADACVVPSPKPASHPSTRVAFLVEDDLGKPVPGAKVSLGDASECSTGPDGGCMIPGESLGPSPAVLFRVEAKGYQVGNWTLSAPETGSGQMVVCVHLRSEQAGQNQLGLANNTSPQPGATGPARHQQGGRLDFSTFWTENETEVLMLASMLLILIGVIAGSAAWTQSSAARGLGPLIAKLEETAAQSKSLRSELNRLTTSLTDGQAELLDAIGSVKRALADQSKREQAQKRESADPVLQVVASQALDSPSRVEPRAPDYPANQHDAQEAYRLLLSNQDVPSRVVYVIRESGSSPADLLQPGSVCLVEVDRSQGSFVLFPDRHGQQGWVFPNPGLIFRKEVFGPVFPHLNRAAFEHSKESVAPVRARAAGERRWTVVIQ